MGRVENVKIVNHSGIARPRLDERELYVLGEVLADEIRRRKGNVSDCYIKRLRKLRRKMMHNFRRVAYRPRT